MISVEQLAKVPFFRGMPAWAMRQFAEAAHEKPYDANDFVMHQHDIAESVFFLLSGGVRFLIRFEGVNDLLVGRTEAFGAVLGWSAFRIPYRYTASVKCEEPTVLLKLPKDVFTEVFQKDPRLGYRTLRSVASALANRLEQTANILVQTRGATEPGGAAWREHAS